MHSQIFVNLPVTDLKRSADFFTKLLVQSGVSCDSREQVDSLVAKARSAGGRVPREAQDHGFMYAHGYEDLDGHTWEIIHMSGMPPQQ